MLIKTLSGDLINVEQQKGDELISQLASLLGVHSTQVHLHLYPEHEEDGMVWVDDRVRVKLQLPARQSLNWSFLSHTKNEDILTYFLNRFDDCGWMRLHLCQNPHPKVIRFLLTHTLPQFNWSNLTNFEGRWTVNPADEIVDILIEHVSTGTIDSHFLADNRNSRAIEYALDHTHCTDYDWKNIATQSSERLIRMMITRFSYSFTIPPSKELALFLRNPHPHVIDWFHRNWDRLPTEVKWSAAAQSSDCRILTEFIHDLNECARDHSAMHAFVKNPADMAVDWVIVQPQICHLYLGSLVANTNDRMVQHVIDTIDFHHKYKDFLPYFMMNSNPLAARYGIEYTRSHFNNINRQTYQMALHDRASTVRLEVLLTWLNEYEWTSIPYEAGDMLNALSHFENVSIEFEEI